MYVCIRYLSPLVSAEYHPIEVEPEIEIARGGFVILYVSPHPGVLPNPERVGLRAILGPLSAASLGAAPCGTVGARHLGPPAVQTLWFWVGGPQGGLQATSRRPSGDPKATPGSPQAAPRQSPDGLRAHRRAPAPAPATAPPSPPAARCQQGVEFWVIRLHQKT